MDTAKARDFLCTTKLPSHEAVFLHRLVIAYELFYEARNTLLRDLNDSVETSHEIGRRVNISTEAFHDRKTALNTLLSLYHDVVSRTTRDTFRDAVDTTEVPL
jgi:hypothetical protein